MTSLLINAGLYVVVVGGFLALVWPAIAKQLNAQHRAPQVVDRGFVSPPDLSGFTARAGQTWEADPDALLVQRLAQQAIDDEERVA